MLKKTGFAEWLLVRRCGKERAAEIVGDLYEQHGVSGSSRRILQIWFAMSWRWMVAVLLTALAVQALWAMGLPLKTIIVLIHHDPRLLRWFNGVLFLNDLVWNVTLLSALRYGFSDRMTRVGLAFSSVLALERCFLFTPHWRLVITALLATVAMGSIFAYRRGLGKPLLSIMTIAASEVVVFPMILFLSIPLWKLYGVSPMMSVKLMFLDLTLCIFAAALVMAKVHRHLHPQSDLFLAKD